MDTLTNASNTYRGKYGEAPKLTTMNYHTWRTTVTYILRAAQAWRIVTGEEQPPEAPAANANATARDRYEEKCDRYNSHYDTAAAIIYQSCTPMIQAYIAGNSDPRSMWQTLKDRVDTASNANGPVMLREQLHKEKFNGEGSVSTFIAKVLTYQDQLVHTPQALTDSEVVSHLITNLPSSWHIIQTIISNQPTKTLDSVILALTNYETQLRSHKDEKEVNKPANNALMATTNRRGLSRGHGRIEKPYYKSTERDKIECWYCL
jgi:gag-polypeptide of LTR copia-type